ncbi:Protein of unknown function [Gryllus bimaculatus]|nr:Protein of unknown function [Gryllus bimaculatus]
MKHEDDLKSPTALCVDRVACSIEVPENQNKPSQGRTGNSCGLSILRSARQKDRREAVPISEEMTTPTQVARTKGMSMDRYSAKVTTYTAERSLETGVRGCLFAWGRLHQPPTMPRAMDGPPSRVDRGVGADDSDFERPVIARAVIPCQNQ